MVKISTFLGAIAAFAGYAAGAGVKVSSDKCGMLMFLDNVKVSTDGTRKSEKLVTVTAAAADPCVIGSKKTRDVTLTVDGKPLVFNVEIRGSDYKIKKTTYGGKEYVPSQSKLTSNTYTYNPAGPVETTFVCQYTAFREKVSKLSKVYSAPTISFGTFSMLVNKKEGKAPKTFKKTHQNQCVGILDEATILGVLTFLLLGSVILFALWMLSKVSPMDRYESPKDKPISVPMDKSK